MIRKKIDIYDKKKNVFFLILVSIKIDKIKVSRRQHNTLHYTTAHHTTPQCTTPYQTKLTSKGNKLDDNDRHPTEEVSANDECKPFHQHPVLLLLGGPQRTLGLTNGDDHPPVGVGNEQEGHQVEAYEDDGGMFPRLLGMKGREIMSVRTSRGEDVS